MRMLPFFKPKKGFMIAGGGLEISASGGGGGGGGSYDILTTETLLPYKINGKNVYARFLQGNTTDSGYSHTIGSGFENCNIMDIYGHLNNGTGKNESVNHWTASPSGYTGYGSVEVATDSSMPVSTLYELVVIYTKTTD